MYSNEDLERFYFQYQTEALPSGESVQSFCKRNSMIHYGSDEGVKMAAAYHSVISTVKLHDMSSLHFLGEFFQKIFSGCGDFLSLTPLNIGLAYSKYRANEYKIKLA